MTDHAAHDDHHDDPMSHVPPPSFWPLGVGIGLILFCVVGTLWMHASRSPEFTLPGTSFLLAVAGLAVLVPLMGWCHQVIKEKRIAHDLDQQQSDLKLFTKLFIVSELTAFASIFAYFYIRWALDGATFQPPENLNLGGPLVALGTMLLLSSSVTCEFAHHAAVEGKMGRARGFLAATVVLGLIFLGLQGMEYGELIGWGFTPAAIGDSAGNSFSTLFYVATGFHGFHVLTGLVMIFLVLIRMQMGHMTARRHFSMIAASWYWHFVDVVWIALVLTVYVL